MRWFFDTSVLVPVFVEEHPHHQASLKAFIAADKRRCYCAAHSLAEVYATMTRLPGPNRLSGEQAVLFLDEIERRLGLVSLDSSEYSTAVGAAASAGITGGALYDALLMHCARKVNAIVIYTWNVNHFRMIGGEFAGRVQTP